MMTLHTKVSRRFQKKHIGAALIFRPSSVGRGKRRGFSLVEMLLAIFILGIGVISIAALFPVGLTQQRRSADAIIGPTVASNALDVLRSKLAADDFGWFFNGAGQVDFDPLVPTIAGDWRWRRPAFYYSNANITDQIGNSRAIPRGSISVFQNTSDCVTEVPFNESKWGVGTPPLIVFTQTERYWPQVPVGSTEAPQYVWDCMFRRFQGRIQVAIFVYRVTTPGGESRPYFVSEDLNVSGEPALPHYTALNGGAAWRNPWHPFAFGLQSNARDELDAQIPGTFPGDPLDFADYDFGWQAPGSWIIDQNGTIHKVLAGRRNAADGPVELSRPTPAMPPLPVFSFFNGDPDRPTFELWHLQPVDAGGYSLTPVYATVREL